MLKLDTVDHDYVFEYPKMIDTQKLWISKNGFVCEHVDS